MPSSKKPSARILSGLCSLFLILSLQACALPQKPPVLTLPSAALYEADIVVPLPPEKPTNADLARWPLDLIEALGLANADRASLREWANQLKEKTK